MEEEANTRKAALQIEGDEKQADYSRLAAHIRDQFFYAQRHRSTNAGWNNRLEHALRVFNGQYDPAKLAQIKQFGGSDVYARVIAVKCRGATALLREVYLGHTRAWGLDPTPEPVLPEDIAMAIGKLVNVEMQKALSAGQPVPLDAVRDRVNDLTKSAKRAAKKKAVEEAKVAEDKLDDMLVEGSFYKALAEFLQDLPLFPFACIKGPVVRMVPDVVWEQGSAVTQLKPKLFWSRVSPFDIYFTPGVSDIEDANCFERLRLTRADLNDLLGLPGYDEDAIRKVLQDFGRAGVRDWMDSTDSTRALHESREDPNFNTSGMIDALEFHGTVQGSMLMDHGFTKEQIPDPDRDYFVQCWIIDRHVIKVQIAPSPRKRHPYYITSFEKVPGTPVGNALPDILHDIQDVCNATLRSLVNNLSISSGPQVVINEERLAPGENADELFPWKRWRVTSDPMGNKDGSQKAIDFFQPASNAQELLGVYEKFTQIADELSAIPRYITGSDRMGGAGRTASGLAMLMGNASKILQTVAANIDRDIFHPLLQNLYDMVMLTDTSGTFRGDEAIRVRGVDVAVQRETDRLRRLEFLQATANPVDIQIMGPKGRAALLRAVGETLALDGVQIVPTDEELDAQMAAQMQQAQQAAMMGHNGGPPMDDTSGGNPPGQAPPAKPQSQALGVAEGKSMRGMT